VGNVVAVPVLDSDVLIDHLRDTGPGRELVDELSSASGFRITAVTAFELALGNSYGHDPAPADALMAAPCLVLTRKAALRAGGLLRELRANGAGIDIRDAMQAGICLEADTPLVTRNIRHFARVSELQVIEPGHWHSST
jgi:predicted nucleic acid-binding protein